MSEKLDDFHAHEVLHTVHVVRNLIDHELTGHPFTLAHPEVAKALEDAQDALCRAYQLTGAVEFVDPATAIEIGGSAVLPASVTEQPVKKGPPEHVCGLQGFGALGDECPACTFWREEYGVPRAPSP